MESVENRNTKFAFIAVFTYLLSMFITLQLPKLFGIFNIHIQGFIKVYSQIQPYLYNILVYPILGYGLTCYAIVRLGRPLSRKNPKPCKISGLIMMFLYMLLISVAVFPQIVSVMSISGSFIKYIINLVTETTFMFLLFFILVPNEIIVWFNKTIYKIIGYAVTVVVLLSVYYYIKTFSYFNIRLLINFITLVFFYILGVALYGKFSVSLIGLILLWMMTSLNDSIDYYTFPWHLIIIKLLLFLCITTWFIYKQVKHRKRSNV